MKAFDLRSLVDTQRAHGSIATLTVFHSERLGTAHAYQRAREEWPARALR
jgi:hypothetical protein